MVEISLHTPEASQVSGPLRQPDAVPSNSA
jgi:hypothetical protein